MTKLDLASETIAGLLREYADAAVSHRSASRAGNHQVANQSYGRLAAVVRELGARGPTEHAAILQLLDDDRLEVRGWAPAHSLQCDPSRAESTLEQIARGPPSMEEFSAKMVLQQWRAGTLSFPS